MNEVGPSVYRTVFRSTFVDADLAIPLVFTIAGIAAVTLSIWAWGVSRRPPTRVIVWGLGAALLGSLVLVVGARRSMEVAWACRDHVDVVSGAVRVSARQPQGGHAGPDVVAIGDRRFAVNAFVAGPGYHRTISRGGDLTEGRRVRVFSCASAIVRVDVISDDEAKTLADSSAGAAK